jgi:hypothetical protein
MTLRDRCEKALGEITRIGRDMEQGVLNGAHIKRWDAQVNYLVDFIHAETGRSASPMLAASAPLVMYFENEHDREEMIAAIRAEKPNMVTRKLP